jgi:hypothetical protein
MTFKELRVGDTFRFEMKDGLCRKISTRMYEFVTKTNWRKKKEVESIGVKVFKTSN